MPVTHVNAKGKTYYLHQGATKTGKPRYYFSPKSEGSLVEDVPEGYEIYEHPNSQVFLRQRQPQIITEAERNVVAKGMDKYASVSQYKIDVKGAEIVVYTSDRGGSALDAILQDFPGPMSSRSRVSEMVSRNAQYTPVMKFELIDEKKRLFATQRYCYRGSIDGWLYVGVSGELPLLVRRYVKHIDQESFYELM